MKTLVFIAQREFMATAANRAFLFAVLATPAMIALALLFIPRMVNQAPPSVAGEVAIIDPTGEQLTEALKASLSPESLARRRAETTRKIDRKLSKLMPKVGESEAVKEQIDQTIAKGLGSVPRFSVVALAPTSSLEEAKGPLTASPSGGAGPAERIALIAVRPDAVVRTAGSDFGKYELFVRDKLDDRAISEIQRAVEDAIVGARLRVSGLDQATIQTLTSVEGVEPTTVTASGDRETNIVLNMMIPMAFMGLLLLAVMLSGQYLLTSTVEEKSNRVAEVLLSAVSATELMAGKILGQLGVGLVVLALYLGLGLVALMTFASLGLIDPWLIVFLLAFFLVAYVTLASVMAAIGSAVNDTREAQGLMTPVLVVIIIPWILWMPISRDPNSAFATVLSFLPPFNSFVMMLRMASSSPPPLWQPVVSVLVGAAAAMGALWFAGKVFRIGLLMFGKPPDLRTLLRWARSG